MSRSIEQVLLSLMPTHGSALPPSLVELAGSLLAQSRHRASTLKAEEEVARLYACCHIACERLKITLNLPPIDSRPPIPPRIYKRLYAHLDHILPAVSGPRTPGKRGTPRAQNRDGRISGRPLPSKSTPTKEQSLAAFRSSNPETPTKPNVPDSADKQGLHPWIQPLIRFMCQEAGHKSLAPSVLAGVESVVAPGGRRSQDAWVLNHLAALCGAVFFFVTQQVRKLQNGTAIDREIYLPARKEILDLLARAREQIPGPRTLDGEAGWQGWQAVGAKDFDSATEQVTAREWLDADWFRGLGDVVMAADATETRPVRDAQKETDTENPGHGESAMVTVRGADTMFQDRYNFFTEQKRKEQRIWEEGILQKIDLLERSLPGTMEIDA